MRRRFKALLLVSVGSFAAWASAADDSCLQRVIPVTVITPTGKSLGSLNPANFKGAIKGLAVETLAVTPNDKPVRVLILLDGSGSMIGSGYWTTYLAIAENLLENMSPGSQAGLVVFSTKLDRRVPLTSRLDQVRSEIAGLKDVKGRSPGRSSQTALWDSIAQAASMFGVRAEGDAIYLMSDGEDNRSHANARAVEKELLMRGIRLFGLAIGSFGPGPTPEEQGGIADMLDVVKSTGGIQAAVPDRNVDPKRPFMQSQGKPTLLATALRTQYQGIFNFERVEIELPLHLREASTWKFETQGIGGDISVVYPEKLAGCGQLEPNSKEQQR